MTAVRVTVQIALFGAALADSQQTQAGAHIGGYLRVCVAMLITEGSPRRPITAPPAGHS